ncbi:MAG: hypothetical protein IJN04_01740 [Clostridia bacterium]|nr:hypothetical protein [Clostridia bacterium]
MSLNLESISVKMTDELDKAVTQKPVTGFMADNHLRSKFVGAKTVMIPAMHISGLGDYDRETGFVSGTVSVSAKPYTLTMDRGRSFQLDREDHDESGIADLAGQVMGEFVRTKVVPEVDAYVLSKLAGYAYNSAQVVEGNPATDAYKMLTTAIATVQNAVGYDEELVAFVDSTMLNALQNSEEIARHLVMNDFKKGELHTQVTSLNGVAILPVPNSRMKTAFEFFDGTSDGEQEGGFIPAENAKSIGLLLMPRRAASLIKKTEQVRCFDPAHNLKADAWKLDYRLYYDVVIRDSLKGGLCTYVY